MINETIKNLKANNINAKYYLRKRKISFLDKYQCNIKVGEAIQPGWERQPGCAYDLWPEKSIDYMRYE